MINRERQMPESRGRMGNRRLVVSVCLFPWDLKFEIRDLRIVALAVAALGAAMSAAAAEAVIVCSARAQAVETLAAREIQRYVYLRTDTLAPITEKAANENAITLAADAGLKPEQYRLKTSAQAGRKTLAITGGSPVAVLYGAYSFAEKLGVRFYLHGDVVPDERIAFLLPDLDETHQPLFDTRGIQPFHDFPEGPDWWDEDDYKSYVSQLPKLRMNFLGLHCYPEGGVGPEPAVWIGLPQDLDEKGQVRFSYPSRWATTQRHGMWGYAAMPTKDFCGGAAQLFAADAYGPAVQDGIMPGPATPEQNNELFNRAGAMFRNAFAHARALGVKTCIGTETPLKIPKAVQQRLKELRLEPGDPAVVQELYRGMFARIAKTCPVDYYWLWTPEDWTWGQNKPGQFEATVKDIEAALGALKDLNHPFTLATCGWVLGPAHDRAALDAVLPKNCPMSCINREVGFTPVEPGFAKVEGRPEWAIPWMEDDPALLIPQLWAGRMRRDAADALSYGCTGLLGIHWRTKVLSPIVSSLAQAAWDQRGWNPGVAKRAEVVNAKPEKTEGRIGGQAAAFPNHAIADTEDGPLYQHVLYDVDAYQLKVPNGAYKVTLKFCEPNYTEKGKRVFGVRLQAKSVIQRLDIFEKAGHDHAVDFTFDEVKVDGGWLDIQFDRIVEFPCIAGILVEGNGITRKINCGGGAYKDYQTDLPQVGEKENFPDKPRDLPVEDFYADWAQAHFGPDGCAGAMAKLLVRLDGGGSKNGKGRKTNLPRPADWVGGPGGVNLDRRPWEQVKTAYAFVEEMAALRPQVKGAGHLDHFDYWLNTFRFLRTIGELACTRGQLDVLAERLKKENDAAKKKDLAQQAVPVRVQLSRLWERAMVEQLAVVSTPGELGTVSNLEQHVRKQLKFLSAHDEELSKALGQPLPAEVTLSGEYRGPARIIVPTVRTQVAKGESLALRVIVLASAEGAAQGALCWRPLGRGQFQRVPLAHVARGVHRVELPAAADGGTAVEYYIEAEAGAAKIVWPASAPALNQTVVIWSGLD